MAIESSLTCIVVCATEPFRSIARHSLHSTELCSHHRASHSSDWYVSLGCSSFLERDVLSASPSNIKHPITTKAKRDGRENSEIQTCFQQNLSPNDLIEVGRIVQRVRELKGADEEVDSRVRAINNNLRAAKSSSLMP